MLFWQKLACISPDEEEPNFLAPSAPRHGSPYHEIVIHLFQQTPEHKILSHEGKDQSNTGFNELERKDRRKHKGCSFPPAFFSHAISAQSLWESDTTVAKQFSCLTPAAYHHPTPLAEPHSTLQKKTSPALDFHQHQGTSCGLGVNILPAVQLPAAMPETSLYWGPSPGSQSNPSWPTLHHLSYGLLSGNPSCRTQVVVKAMQILKQLP